MCPFLWASARTLLLLFPVTCGHMGASGSVVGYALNFMCSCRANLFWVLESCRCCGHAVPSAVLLKPMAESSLAWLCLQPLRSSPEAHGSVILGLAMPAVFFPDLLLCNSLTELQKLDKFPN